MEFCDQQRDPARLITRLTLTTSTVQTPGVSPVAARESAVPIRLSGEPLYSFINHIGTPNDSERLAHRPARDRFCPDRTWGLSPLDDRPQTRSVPGELSCEQRGERETERNRRRDDDRAD